MDVPAGVLSWDVEWPEYDPPEYTAPYVLHFGPDSPTKHFKWAHPENVSDAIEQGLIAESATNTPIIVHGVCSDRPISLPRLGCTISPVHWLLH